MPPRVTARTATTLIAALLIALFTASYSTAADPNADPATTDSTEDWLAHLWLPRDISATLTVTQGECSATVPISTGEDAPTCITTLHLT